MSRSRRRGLLNSTDAINAMKKLLLPAAVFLAALPAAAQEPRKPNFIVIFADDQGWGDLGIYGHPDIRTPHIDRMAREGIRFTSFYAAPFCGPSRAALMTGSYPPRASLAFNHGPKQTTGIHPGEITVAELLKTQGYATMMIGKWHLGDAPRFLPHRHGFDHWFGIPFSNDMWRYHPVMPIREPEDERMISARERADFTGFAGKGSYYDLEKGRGFPHPLPLMDDDEVVEYDPDQRKLTTLYTQKALDFIESAQDGPFFLYLPHAMPHVPLFVANSRWGRSLRGRYGDVIEEIDWSVGRILDKLDRLGIAGDTLVVYTSDNGPWLEYGIDAGSAGPFKPGQGDHLGGRHARSRHLSHERENPRRPRDLGRCRQHGYPAHVRRTRGRGTAVRPRARRPRLVAAAVGRKRAIASRILLFLRGQRARPTAAAGGDSARPATSCASTPISRPLRCSTCTPTRAKNSTSGTANRKSLPN